MISENQIFNTRKYPRRTYQRLVGTLVQGTYTISKAVQISEGGMLIQIPQDLIVGSHIVVTLAIPDRAEIVVRGEVRYGRPEVSEDGKLWGFKFANLNDQHRRAIRQYIAEKRSED